MTPISASQSDFPNFTENSLKTAFDCRFVGDLASHLSRLRSENGRVLYFIGTSYLSPRDNLLTAPSANRSLRKFHLCLLDHLAGSSRINRPWFRAIEPQMHSFIDVPGSKSKDYSHYRTRLSNSSFHHHSILAADPRHASRLDAFLDPVLREHFRQECVDQCQLQSWDVQRVGSSERDIVKVADYASHHARKHFRADQWDEMYVPLPKANVEFRKPLARNDFRSSNGVNPLTLVPINTFSRGCANV